MIREEPACRLLVRVSPRAAKDAIVGWHGERLKVRLVAAPESGRANAALVALLAEVLGVARSCVTIQTGHASRDKTVWVEGVSLAMLAARLPVRRARSDQRSPSA